MFCTKCGKQLHDGDAFCAHCGAKVREELLFKSEPKTTSYGYDNIVFNPPFKAEADRRTQHIAQEAKPYSSEPKRETVHLDWNLDGFPSAERKANDDLEFNWDAVIDRRREPKPVSVEKIVPETEIKTENPLEESVKAPSALDKLTQIAGVELGAATEPAVEASKMAESPEESLFETKKEEPLSIEELERALFGDEDFAKLEPSNDFGLTMQYKHIDDSEKDKLEQTLVVSKSEFNVVEETPAEAPIETEPVIEEPAEESVEILTEEPTEAPIEVSTAALTEVPVEEPIEAATEAPVEAPTEEPEAVPAKLDENFFTFNAKKDAFQELLDRERARLKALEEQRQSQWEEITPAEPTDYVPRKALDFDDVFVEPKIPLVPPLKEVAVVQAPLTARVIEYYEPEVVQAPLTARVEVALEEIQKIEIPVTEGAGEISGAEAEVQSRSPFQAEPSEADKTDFEAAVSGSTEIEIPVLDATEEEKTKLRYSDIFAVDDIDTADSDKPQRVSKKTEVADAYDKIFEDDEEEEQSKHGILKFVIILLALVVVAEIVIIGAKFLAPDSALTQFVDDLLSKVTLLFE